MSNAQYSKQWSISIFALMKSGDWLVSIMPFTLFYNVRRN